MDLNTLSKLNVLQMLPQDSYILKAIYRHEFSLEFEIRELANSMILNCSPHCTIKRWFFFPRSMLQ